MQLDERPPYRVAVAYSAGRDSTALLHATACAAREAGGVEVWALHVHHGLSAHADAWLAHAEQTCAKWASQGLPVRLLARRVMVPLAPGDSVESEAREVRYAALSEMAHEVGVDLVLLAHHRRDQAETVLLQALRGAGVKGLAAMPGEAERDGLRWARPWLRHSRQAIEAYVQHHRLAFVDDDSNADGRFARNRLRLDVWPALEAAFPHAEAGLAASAARVQDVLPVVDAWAETVLASMLVDAAEGASANGPGLDAAQWADLSGAQRRLVLAHWYRAWRGRGLSATWLERLAHEVPGLVYRQHTARWPEVALALYRGVLWPLDGCAVGHLGQLGQGNAHGGTRAASSGDVVDSEGRAAGRACALSVLAPGDHALPSWCGVLRVTEVAQGGVSPGLLAHARALTRCGGEQFQMGPGRPPRALKKQFQSLGVPEWRRHGPLIWSEGRLVFVPVLGVDARCLAPSGSPQWGLEWVAHGS